MSLDHHHQALRDALLAVLFIRAKLRAELGAVPVEIQRRVTELVAALGECTAAMQRQRTARAVEQASERAAEALAGAEVELSTLA